MIINENEIPVLGQATPDSKREELLAEIAKLQAAIAAKKLAEPAAVQVDPTPAELSVEAKLAAERAKYLHQDEVQASPEQGSQVQAKSSVKKNQVPVKPVAGRKLVLLSKSLAGWGKVPQQQADLATILSSNLTVGEEVPEDAVLRFVADGAPLFPSLAASVQDPTYLLRYYLGLNKRDGKHVGFVGRNFVRVVG